MIHEVKIWPSYFEDVRDGRKPFEVRRDDRDYDVDDTLILREWDPVHEVYTGRTTQKRITYVLADHRSEGLQPGYCVLGIAAPGDDT